MDIREEEPRRLAAWLIRLSANVFRYFLKRKSLCSSPDSTGRRASYWKRCRVKVAGLHRPSAFCLFGASTHNTERQGRPPGIPTPDHLVLHNGNGTENLCLSVLFCAATAMVS